MKYKTKNSPESRLWAKIDKTGGPDSCWTWNGAKTKDGYGHQYISGKTVLSHRAAYLYSGFEIPSGFCVLHKCDNPLCCNPSHLFIGTRADNIADKVRKNRQARGERIGVSKVSNLQVVALKRLRSLGWRQKTLSIFFGLSQGHVSGILSNRYRFSS